tara:strand:- start:548 stop:1204 length:657 start_codon:yes stop_codon:yes gene_type:complete
MALFESGVYYHSVLGSSPNYVKIGYLSKPDILEQKIGFGIYFKKTGLFSDKTFGYEQKDDLMTLGTTINLHGPKIAILKPILSASYERIKFIYETQATSYMYPDGNGMIFKSEESYNHFRISTNLAINPIQNFFINTNLNQSWNIRDQMSLETYNQGLQRNEDELVKVVTTDNSVSHYETLEFSMHYIILETIKLSGYYCQSWSLKFSNFAFSISLML